MKNQIKELLKKVNTVLVAGHSDPDGDSIGSMLGLGFMLEQAGKTVHYYCVDSVPRVYSFLPGVDKIKKNLTPGQRFDALFVVDSSDLSRLGDKTTDFRALAGTIVNIDHHHDNTNFGDINYVVAASSTSEAIFDLALYLKAKLDRRIAECLYVALLTDTGNFRYENTTIKAVRSTALAMSGLRFAAEGKICWTAVTGEMMEQVGAMGEDVVGIVDCLRSIEGVEVAIFFREKDEVVKMNFRSKDRVNVSEIARKFNGGGHLKAAGAVVNGNLEKVEAMVIAENEKQLQWKE